MLTPVQFTALCDRLEAAATALRERGCLLQSIARRYYLVYAIAGRAAEKYGVTIATERRRGARSDRFTHQSIPDVVYALYTGNKRGNADPGSTPGIGSGRLSERQVIRYVNELQKDRKYADYGPTEEREPYGRAETDERLAQANCIIDDLRTLL